MTAHRDVDLVLVGATGFVGRLTAAHLARNAEVRIALAGRDRGRLADVRSDLPATARGWDLIEVDVTDADQARALAGRTRVVCTTVGPYQQYGKALATACAEAGTHYCDLVGEVEFVRWSIDTNAEAAARTGARIVHSCGFDSIPSDLGVYETARAARAAGAGALTDTVTHVRAMRGGLSGGTISSMRGQVTRAAKDPRVQRLVDDPDALVPDRTDPTPAARNRGGRLPAVSLDRTTGRWEGPFVMAPYNSQVVRWSNARGAGTYGRDFRYAEVSDTGAGPLGAVRAVTLDLVGRVLLTGMRVAPLRAVLDRMLPAPGEGPSEKTMTEGYFVVDVDAVTTSGARYRTRLADRRDPGYTSTAVMLGESALALACDDLDSVTAVNGSPASGAAGSGGGVHTPSTALGSLLVDRLRTNGFRIETGRL